MRPALRRPLLGLCAALMIGLAAQAGDVKLELRVSGTLTPEEWNKFALIVLPEDTVDAPLADIKFDPLNYSWVLPLSRPTHSHRTDLSIVLKNGDKEVPLRPIYVALGRIADDRVVAVEIPDLGATDGREQYAFLNGIWEKGTRGLDEAELLRAYLIASGEIERLTADGVNTRFPLVQAMVVFAEAMFDLVVQSEWFGVPIADLRRYRGMIDTMNVALSANSSGDPATQERLRRAAQRFSSAENWLYARHWRAILNIPRYDCESIYPAAESFYNELRGLGPRYADVRALGEFTRTQVLLERATCFRKLLMIQPGVRSFDPYVAEHVFDKVPIGEVAHDLRDDLMFESEAIQKELGGDPSAPPCEKTEGAVSLAQVCQTIAYLDEARPMLKDVTDVTQ